MTKRAVVLFNLGGPDQLTSVKPFLFNLFYDPAIISLPNPLRFLIAKLISSRREKEALEIYKELGGGSPLLPNTTAQAKALAAKLGAQDRVFIAMRYWAPRACETVRSVKDFDPDEVVLLPLYPQFSGTTTGSSYHEWIKEADKINFKKPTRFICCYPTHEGVTRGYATLLQPYIDRRKGRPFRVLFSAHGLPESKVKAGDPYPEEVYETTKGVLSHLDTSVDSILCYQSRVGPVKWIGPETEGEIARAAREGVGVILVPIAFVSEHSETLVELDVEYKTLGESLSIPFYDRVPALGIQESFVQGLADLVTCERPKYQCRDKCPWRCL